MMTTGKTKRDGKQLKRRRKAARAVKKTSEKAEKRYSRTERPTPPIQMRMDSSGVIADRKDYYNSRVRQRPSWFSNDEIVEKGSSKSVSKGWRILSLLIVAIAFTGIILFLNAEKYIVKEFTLINSERLSSQEINAVAQIIGNSVFKLAPDKIKQDLLLAYPEIEEIEISLNVPNNVEVSVSERTPLLVLNQYGDTKWVDEFGVLFRQRSEMEGLITLEANGLGVDTTEGGRGLSMIDQGVIQAVMQVADIAPPDAPIVYDTEHGLGWTDPRGWIVYFGHELDSIETKVDIYQEMVTTLSNKGVNLAMISVEYLHAPYYRLER